MELQIIYWNQLMIRLWQNSLNKFVTQHKIERKEALLSRKDMATQYIWTAFRNQIFRFYREKYVWKSVSAISARCFLFLHDKPRQEIFLEQRKARSIMLTKIRFVELKPDMWILLVRPEEDMLFSGDVSENCWRKRIPRLR